MESVSLAVKSTAGSGVTLGDVEDGPRDGGGLTGGGLLAMASVAVEPCWMSRAYTGSTVWISPYKYVKRDRQQQSNTTSQRGVFVFEGGGGDRWIAPGSVTLAVAM